MGPKASALTHIVQSLALEPKHPSSPIVSTSSIWHDAIVLYISQLPDRDQQSIISTKDDSALTSQSIETLIAPLITKHKHGVVMRLLVKLGTTLQHVRSFATVVDVAVQSHPNVACLIWGGIRLILQVCSTTKNMTNINQRSDFSSSRYHARRLNSLRKCRSCSKDCQRTCPSSRNGQACFLEQSIKSYQRA